MSMSYLLKPSLRSQYVIHATTLQIVVTLKVLLSFYFDHYVQVLHVIWSYKVAEVAMQFLIKGTVSNKSFCAKSGWRGVGVDVNEDHYFQGNRGWAKLNQAKGREG